MILRALLFDFDGLILDTEMPEVVVWREMFAEHGASFPDEIWQAMIGQNDPGWHDYPLRVLSEITGLKLDISRLLEESRVRRQNKIESEEVQPGIEGLLDQARRHNIRAAVVSSSKRQWVEGHLTRIGLAERFEALVCLEEGLRSKPAPDLYLAALERLGIESDDAIAIEDSPRGIEAAKAAGLFCAVVPNELTMHLDLTEADVLFPTLEGVGLMDLAREAGLSLI